VSVLRATASFAVDLVQSMPRAAWYLGGIVREASRRSHLFQPPDYGVRTVSDEKELAQLAPAWNKLHSRSGARSPFMSFPWLHAWWLEIGRLQGHELKVLAVEHRGEVVGLGGFYVSTDRFGIRVMRLLGDSLVGSDYLDVLADPEHQAAVAEALIAEFGGLRDIDGFTFADLDERSHFLQALQRSREALLAFEVSQVSNLPVVAVGGSRDRLHAQLSSNMRYNLKRKWKRLIKRYPHAHLSITRDQSQVAPALDKLFDLHRRRWVSKGMTGNFVRPEVRAFHRLVAPTLLDRNMLRLYSLNLEDDRVAATIYCLRLGGREFYLQAGMDPSDIGVSPGFCLMKEVIEHCADDGVKEFDMLRGEESYKTHWARSEHRTICVRFARPTARGLLFATSEKCKREMVHMIKRRMPPDLVDEMRAFTA
jgi:CelD/BcsL family acetyltransferase involved in cellulose biosynthesis